MITFITAGTRKIIDFTTQTVLGRTANAAPLDPFEQTSPNARSPGAAEAAGGPVPAAPTTGTSTLIYGDTSLNLTFMEKSYGLMLAPPIQTLSVYQGALPVVQIRERAIQIIQSNPWLGARLVKTPAGYDAQYFANPCRENCAASVTEMHVPSLSLSEAHRDATTDSMQGAMLPMSGFGSVGNLDLPLFRVVIAHDDHGRSGLMICMSHIIADGYTYYRVLQMFNENETVVTLNATRDETVLKAAIARIDSSYLITVGANVGLFTGIIANAVASKFWPWYVPHVNRLSIIDTDAIKSLKAQFQPQPGVPFISTHDIIASQFLTVAEREANVIAINTRDRIPGATLDTAGNLEAVLVKSRASVARPEYIRRAVTAASPGGSGIVNDAASQPSPLGTRNGLGIFTDWASLCRHIQFSSCQLLTHIPFYTRKPLDNNAAGILFQPQPGKLGIMSWLDQNLDARWHEKSAIVDRSVADPFGALTAVKRVG